MVQGIRPCADDASGASSRFVAGPWQAKGSATHPDLRHVDHHYHGGSDQRGHPGSSGIRLPTGDPDSGVDGQQPGGDQRHHPDLAHNCGAGAGPVAGMVAATSASAGDVVRGVANFCQYFGGPIDHLSGASLHAPACRTQHSHCPVRPKNTRPGRNADRFATSPGCGKSRKLGLRSVNGHDAAVGRDLPHLWAATGDHRHARCLSVTHGCRGPGRIEQGLGSCVKRGRI